MFSHKRSSKQRMRIQCDHFRYSIWLRRKFHEIRFSMSSCTRMISRLLVRSSAHREKFVVTLVSRVNYCATSCETKDLLCYFVWVMNFKFVWKILIETQLNQSIMIFVHTQTDLKKERERERAWVKTCFDCKSTEHIAVSLLKVEATEKYKRKIKRGRQYLRW